MNYYFDVKLNFQEKLYKYFEWDTDDKVVNINKIAIIKINFSDFLKLYSGKVLIEKNLYDSIIVPDFFDKRYNHAAIFTDTNNSIVVAFDETMQSKLYSSLSFNDELNIQKVSHRLKKEIVKFDLLESFKSSDITRHDEKINCKVNKEIDSLIKAEKYSKLRYWHNTLFKSNESDINIIIDVLKKLSIEKKSILYEKISYSFKEV